MRKIPRAFRGETAVWKKITEDPITTTRFKEFPTAWLTGEISCSIE